jgi:hypothetical protein
MSHTEPTPEHLVPELALSVTVVRKDDAAVSEVPVVAPPSYHEPVVTRRELWSYYCAFHLDYHTRCDVPHIIISVLQRR